MPDFDEARKNYSSHRSTAESARDELIRAQEKAKRLTREIERLSRKANDDAGETSREELLSSQRRAKETASHIKQLKEDLAASAAARFDALDAFSVFTDPVQGIENLDDDTPIVLFPLRLETRFKTIVRDNTPHQFLWVRVFPDDVLVDSFQPEISETELANTTTYWAHTWRAGKNQDGQKAAWSALVKSHGAGRAKWLIDQYAPLNPDDEPQTEPEDHVLVICPKAPVAETEKAAIASFWSRIWSTAGAEHDAAFAELQTALGASRATTVENELVPVNLLDVSVKPDPALNPVVAFLDLPNPSTLPISTEDWTRGARTWLLPERLVLVGYKDGTEVIREIGNPIPSELQIGPDPSADESEQIHADGSDLELPDSMLWTADFDRAVTDGMAFRVNLSATNVSPEFDRLFVVGIRLSSDAEEGAAEIEKLITNHQASRKGFSLLPQGRATNNTDGKNASYSWWEDPEESFTHYFESETEEDPDDWRRRKDGAWLAGLLGVDQSVIRNSTNYYGTDQAEARAMNIALWPGTLGYYMEQMMEPVFSEDTVLKTRDFFTRFVIGRGTTPLVKVGRQPYGILPVTPWSKMAWWKSREYVKTQRKSGLPDTQYLEQLSDLVERAAEAWTSFSGEVAHVGSDGDDAHQVLLDILGLHPTSAEFYQRYSQSFTQYYNVLGFSQEPVSEPLTFLGMLYIDAGLKTLEELGWTMPEGGELPDLLEKIFLKKPNLLKGSLVGAELSETTLLPVEHEDGDNYISWLKKAALNSHDMLRKQEGFTSGVPNALLYMMLRHALDLGYVSTGLELRREALQLSEVQFRSERREPKFIHISEEAGSDSAWKPLYQAEPAVTGNATQRLGDYIPSILTVRNPYLRSQVDALDVLEKASTASLERALAEHVDCLSYRLDAWRMGLHSAQLSFMRNETEQGFGKGGSYVGAYGWLENVRPKSQELSSVKLDSELEGIFGNNDLPDLVSDSSNYGHIHAPSLDHAVTAAILRNGHLANATPEAPDLLAVDLSSERVRMAKTVIEGIRNGQSLGALLGYRLERALHDEEGLFLDALIYDLRKAFPLVGNRNLITKVTAIKRISQVEARNVLDGVAFMEHIADTGKENYPYGLSNLPSLGEFTGPGLPSAAEIGKIVDGHVKEMRSVGDAVGDISVAEGVYQVVRGNYDRGAAALDAFSKGTFPVEPDVVKTPRSGKTLTHRVCLHLKGGILPGDPSNKTPRAKGEPGLAVWLANQVPDPATVFARVSWRDEASDSHISLTVSMADLELGPVDLFYLIDAGGARDMPGFDDLLIDYAVLHGIPVPRHDAVFSIEYKPEGVPGLTLFELAPLVRSLRGFVLGARPLRPTDLSLQNEATKLDDVGFVIRSDKVQEVLSDLQSTLPAIDAFISTLETDIGDPVTEDTARDNARDNIDTWVTSYASVLRKISPFGLRAASLTAAIEGCRHRFKKMHAAIGDLIERWESKQSGYVTIMDEYGDLIASGLATDDEKVSLLIRAGRIVSTTVITPLPPLPNLETDVANLKGHLDTELGNLRSLRDGNQRIGDMLTAITAFAPTIASIDQAPFKLDEFRQSVLALAKEVLEKATLLKEDVNRRVSQATDALASATASVDDKAQNALSEAAKALLGDAFIVLPEFTLSTTHLAEWENAWADRTALVDHLKTGSEATPFPIDDWLNGVARVREKERHLEMAGLLGEALGTPGQMTLEAVQFPYRQHDVWLGMEFPGTFANGDPFVLDEDKLLYTGQFDQDAEIDPSNPNKTYTGLMVDEWVEVIPTEQETTGLAFHFDRPNSEAPQAILLATPPSFRGAWQWQDLVDSLHETLDMARMRAVEPAHLDETFDFERFRGMQPSQTDELKLGAILPAVMSAVTMFPITAMLNFALNNNIHLALMESDNE